PGQCQRDHVAPRFLASTPVVHSWYGTHESFDVCLASFSDTAQAMTLWKIIRTPPRENGCWPRARRRRELPPRLRGFHPLGKPGSSGDERASKQHIGLLA